MPPPNKRAIAHSPQLNAYREMLPKLTDAVIAQLARTTVGEVAAFRRALLGETPAVPTADAAPRLRRSRLDPFLSVIGTRPDGEIAALAGVDRKTVLLFRQARGITAAVPRGRSNPPPSVALPPPAPLPIARQAPSAAPVLRSSKLDAFRHLAGVQPDRAIAELAGVTSEGVRQYRLKLGIPPAQAGVRVTEAVHRPPTTSAASRPSESAPSKTPRLRRSRLDAHLDIVGVLSDADVAKRVGLTPNGVRKFRIAHNILSARARGSSPARAETQASQPSSRRGPRAYCVLAERDGEQARFVVMGADMGSAMMQAVQALAGRPGNWRLTKAWELVGDVL